MDTVSAKFMELRTLAGRFNFDLSRAIDRLAESGTPVWACDVDYSATPTTGYAVARYRLAERLENALAALRVLTD